MTKRLNLLLIAVLSATVLPVCAGELPPTVLGRNVGEPGDNQYQSKAQSLRHPQGNYADSTGCPAGTIMPARSVEPLQVSAPAVRPYEYAKAAHVPDVSIEPITADEPIARPGFPPMPYALELGELAVNRGQISPLSTSNTSDNGFRGTRQHYQHFAPGSFQKSKVTGAEQSENAEIAEPVQRSGYKAGTPGPITRYNGGGEVYSTGTTGKGATSVPAPIRKSSDDNTQRSSVARDLKKIGAPPELDNEADAPNAPDPVLINQSTTTDISLPDDASISSQFKNGKRDRIFKNAARRGKQFGKNMLRSTGIGF